MALKERQQLGVEPALPVEVVPGTDPQAGAATQRQCVLVEVKDAAEMGVIPATDQEQRPGQQGRLGPMPNPAPSLARIPLQPAQHHAGGIEALKELQPLLQKPLALEAAADL